MKITWKRIAILGLAVLVPVLIRVVVQLPDRERRIIEHEKEMAICQRCHKLFKVRAGMAFILHLMDQHGWSFDDAEAAISRVYRKLRFYLEEKGA